jgi:hypothetical protein
MELFKFKENEYESRCLHVLVIPMSKIFASRGICGFQMCAIRVKVQGMNVTLE